MYVDEGKNKSVGFLDCPGRQLESPTLKGNINSKT